MNRVTLVCCYNNREQYNEMLYSVKQQTEQCEVIEIDNVNKTFSSCSKAFNAVIPEIKTPYVIFLHQDIIFEKNDSLYRIVEYIASTGENDIVGVAGAANGIKANISNILHGSDKELAGSLRVSGLKECDSVDECLFGGHTKHFIERPFNEILCDGWHLYAVEMCLDALVNHNKVYVCDVEVYHKSRGKIDLSFNAGFYRICKAYSGKLDYVHSTCAFSRTSGIHPEISYIKSEIVRYMPWIRTVLHAIKKKKRVW